MSKRVNLACIPGDGIGKEVTEQSLKILYQIFGEYDVKAKITQYPFGAEYYLQTGHILDDYDLRQLAKHDAIIFGAVGGDPQEPRLQGGIIERGLLLKIRFAFDHYINLRPSVLFPGVDSVLKDPKNIDFVVVREGTEGPYVGNGGSIRKDTPHEIANEVSVNTAFGVERTVRFAFEAAMKRKKKLTLVHKTNVLVHAGTLWQRTVDRIQEEYPEVTTDYMHVDAAMIHMVQSPDRFDVIVTDNLFGDIVTDLSAAISGGIGLAASGNINPDKTFPSMFEPVHGSAPDIAGQQKADPTASVLSLSLLLDHVELPEAAERLRRAVAQDLAERVGKPARTTSEIGQDILTAFFNN